MSILLVTVFRLFALILGFVLVAHWAGCLAYYIGTLASSNEPTWLVDGTPVPLSHKYVRWLYWSLITLTTTGYGMLLRMVS